MSLLIARGWNQMIFKVPSNPNHSLILWRLGKAPVSAFEPEGSAGSAAAAAAG